MARKSRRRMKRRKSRKSRRRRGGDCVQGSCKLKKMKKKLLQNVVIKAMGTRDSGSQPSVGYTMDKPYDEAMVSVSKDNKKYRKDTHPDDWDQYEAHKDLDWHYIKKKIDNMSEEEVDSLLSFGSFQAMAGQDVKIQRRTNDFTNYMKSCEAGACSKDGTEKKRKIYIEYKPLKGYLPTGGKRRKSRKKKRRKKKKSRRRRR